MQRLPKASLFGRLKGARIGDDTFWAGVGVKADIVGYGVGHGRHAAGRARGERALRFVGMIGMQRCPVVVGERAGVFRMCSERVMLGVGQGVIFVLCCC